MAYPHSISETLADGAVHATGLLLALPAVLLLLADAGTAADLRWAAVLYGGCLTFSLLASAIYHLSPADRLRPWLHRIDHAAIYFKIAGTYTPFVALIGSAFAYGVLILIWIMAFLGAVAKLSFWKANARGSLALYLGMGWLSVLLIGPMYMTLPGSALALIVVGGLIYSGGTWIFAHPGMRYQNALWHLVVLTASGCFFAAVALSL
jgi:hemolysin III